jgi:hypothetical protein
MKCSECGGTYQQKTDRFEYADPLVGPISVQGLPYFQCDKNGEILFTDEIARALDEARNIQIQELLRKYPISDFISSAETTELLGITRQALHKNQRIRHGFIYQTIFGGVTVYLRQSVLKFKKTGDGRFPLNSGYEFLSKHNEGAVPVR